MDGTAKEDCFSNISTIEQGELMSGAVYTSAVTADEVDDYRR